MSKLSYMSQNSQNPPKSQINNDSDTSNKLMKITTAFDINDSAFDFDLDDLYTKLMCFNVMAYYSTKNVANATRIIFPQKLYELLQRSSHPEIISWLPDGKSFKIHKKDDFEQFILSEYFGGMKFRSFQRQLHLYGFAKISNRINSYDYRHIDFTMDNTSNLGNIRRIKRSKVQPQIQRF